MSGGRTYAVVAAGAMFALPLFVLSGCGRDEVTSPRVREIAPALAAGGGSDGPTVKSADPDSAPRNVTLDVRVLGSGYDAGSRATWAVNGDTAFAATKIRTNATRYVSSREIVANITIAADAVEQLYDVMVVTSRGKKGIGIEVFAVSIGANGGPYTALLDDAVSYKVRSDQGTMYLDGVDCIYSQRVAGGFYQLRTIQNSGVCKAVQRPGWRWFTIDLGASNTFDLDQDGIAEPIEQAPGRLMTADAFANGTTSTSVGIFVFEVNPVDGSTTEDPAWHLVYTNPAAVTATPTGGRVITAGTGLVSVSKPTQVGRKVVFTQVGTVQLPFKLTLEP